MEELIFGVIGGTALLMYGVDKMGDGLEKASGETMKKILTVLTGKVWSAFLVGILVTAIVQSSTAVTVLTVGFVNSGLMELDQAIGIIFGANIGTTVTAQLMAFSFKFNLTDIALPILGIGFAVERIFKNQKVKNLGQAVMGFGMMFLGLKILNGGVPYMEQSESLKYFFATYASSPLIGILLGAFATAMVHSSAATIGIVMVLSKAGLIDLQTAIYITLGENIGTCITAQLASMNGNIHARRTAWAHTFYNVFGVIVAVIFMPIFYSIVLWFTHKVYGTNVEVSVYIANAHTLFNTLNAIFFLTFNKAYVKFLERVIRPKEDDKHIEIQLDPLLLDTPPIALEATKGVLVTGVELVKSMLFSTMEIVINNNLDTQKDIEVIESDINRIQKDMTTYIVKLSEKELSDTQSIALPATLNAVTYIERAGDRIYEIGHLLEKKILENLSFSEEATNEILDIGEIVAIMSDICIQTLKGDFTNTEKIEELEDLVDERSKEYQENYIERLNDGTCDIDSGVLYIDILGHLERVADHLYKTTLLAKDELMGTERIDTIDNNLIE